jgi:hypothetical protein
MATDPQFASTINNAAAALSGVDAAPPVGTNQATLITAGANGTKIEEVRVSATGQSAASLVYLFLFDGTNYRLWDVVTVRAVTPSTTAAPYRSANSDFASGGGTYANLFIKSGWSLRASMSVAPVTGSLIVQAFGADL